MVDENEWADDLLKEIASREETSSPPFVEEKNSLSCIRSTTYLINCSERREVASEKNVAQVCPRPNPNNERICAPELINNSCVRRPLNLNGGYLANDNANTYSPPRPRATITASPNSAALTERKRAAIYTKISQEIGNFWRRFGRELAVPEGAMDQIELQFPRDFPSLVYKLFQLFEDDNCNNRKKHAVLICRALEKCHQTNLRRKVEEIISME